MNGMTNYISEQAWEETVTAWYVLVDDGYQRLIAKRGVRLRTSGPEHLDRFNQRQRDLIAVGGVGV